MRTKYVILFLLNTIVAKDQTFLFVFLKAHISFFDSNSGNSAVEHNYPLKIRYTEI